MWFEGKIVIKKKRMKKSYDIAAGNKKVLSKIISNSLEEIDEKDLSKIYVKIKVKK